MVFNSILRQFDHYFVVFIFTQIPGHTDQEKGQRDQGQNKSRGGSFIVNLLNHSFS